MSWQAIISLFRRPGREKYWLIGSGLLVLVIIIFFWIGKDKIKSITPPENQSTRGTDGIQVQSYAAPQAPSLAAGDLILGDKNAPLKIFVYEDYASPYSAALADTLNRIQAEAGGRIAVISRPFVVGSSPAAYQAVAAVECAADSGKGAEMRDLFLAWAKNHQAPMTDLSGLAATVGLDQTAFGQCLTNEGKSGKIEQLETDAARYQVQGAPTMFIGDEMIVGARPYADFTDSNGDRIEGLKTIVGQKLSKS